MKKLKNKYGEEVANQLGETGHRIAEVRNQKGMTIEELSEKSGISESTISRLENGKSNPKLSTLIKILDVLDIRLSNVFVND